MTTMNQRYLAALKSDHTPAVSDHAPTCPKFINADAVLCNCGLDAEQERAWAAHQSRLSDQADLRARFSPEREKRGYDAYERHVREETSAYRRDLI